MYVYRIVSVSNPGQQYTGITRDLRRRLTMHNSGDVKHTSKFRPWRFESVHYFRNPIKAHAFERYLKSGSGRTFAKRHL